MQDILDEEEPVDNEPKGNIGKVIAWMILSGIIVIGIFLFCIILMVATGTPEKLDYMPIGFKYLPISFVFNMALFSGQLLLISVTFKRHLKTTLSRQFYLEKFLEL